MWDLFVLPTPFFLIVFQNLSWMCLCYLVSRNRTVISFLTTIEKRHRATHEIVPSTMQFCKSVVFDGWFACLSKRSVVTAFWQSIKGNAIRRKEKCRDVRMCIFYDWLSSAIVAFLVYSFLSWKKGKICTQPILYIVVDSHSSQLWIPFFSPQT